VCGDGVYDGAVLVVSAVVVRRMRGAVGGGIGAGVCSGFAESNGEGR
jgi:hypothetical protein